MKLTFDRLSSKYSPSVSLSPLPPLPSKQEKEDQIKKSLCHGIFSDHLPCEIARCVHASWGYCFYNEWKGAGYRIPLTEAQTKCPMLKS